MKRFVRLLENFFKPDSSFWMTFTFQGRSSVSWGWQMFRVTKHQKKTENVERIRELLHEDRRRTIHVLADNVRISYWSLPGNMNRKFEHAPYCSSITTTGPPTRPWKPQSLWQTTWLSFPFLPTRQT
jgi:hypothetical protein